MSGISYAYSDFLWDTFQRDHRWTLMADTATISALDRRWQKALEIPVTAVEATGDHSHLVNSDSDPDKTYLINRWGCSCPDSQRAAPFGWCKHHLAAWMAAQSAIDANKTVDQVQQDLDRLYLSDQELEDRYAQEKGRAA